MIEFIVYVAMIVIILLIYNFFRAFLLFAPPLVGMMVGRVYFRKEIGPFIGLAGMAVGFFLFWIGNRIEDAKLRRQERGVSP